MGDQPVRRVMPFVMAFGDYRPWADADVETTVRKVQRLARVARVGAVPAAGRIR
jgi:hypothetical protein